MMKSLLTVVDYRLSFSKSKIHPNFYK